MSRPSRSLRPLVPALAALSAETGVPVTGIGRLVEGPAGGVTVTDPQGRALDLPTRGWDHF